jgi:predicted naringenin-chalcone synthase
MTWEISPWGFLFHLSKEIPVHIMRHAQTHVEKLLKKVPRNDKPLIYAIHPGGPKIIDYLQQLFCCTDQQISHSRQILQNHGNMSSATLPFIWKSILEDPAIEDGTQIISLAFGPGLTIAGGILEKSCGI